jgi:hypothetical protein
MLSSPGSEYFIVHADSRPLLLGPSSRNIMQIALLWDENLHCEREA